MISGPRIIITALLVPLLSVPVFGETVPADHLSPALRINYLRDGALFRASIPADAVLRPPGYLTDADARFMRWIENGRVEDIAPQSVTYKDLRNRRQTEITGLKNNVEIALPGGRRLFITDDEQQVLPFWWKIRREGIIGSGERFLHIDAHLDTLLVNKINHPIAEQASVRDVYELSFTSQESGFLIPAFNSRILNDRSAYLMDPRVNLLASRLDVQWAAKGKIKQVRAGKRQIKTSGAKFSLISVDLDALAGLSKEKARAHLEYIAGLCRKAKAVTICTSPAYMLDQQSAIEYAVYLTRLLQEQRYDTPAADGFDPAGRLPLVDDSPDPLPSPGTTIIFGEEYAVSEAVAEHLRAIVPAEEKDVGRIADLFEWLERQDSMGSDAMDRATIEASFSPRVQGAPERKGKDTLRS
ncbi:MAG: hypothetical protein PHO30_04770, partial [Candidatus Omnitrophica bacterium]|nr:hypothetical protein [Candidatus Omnitrophota bacterium]